jgi:hypothetical protein
VEKILAGTRQGEANRRRKEMGTLLLAMADGPRRQWLRDFLVAGGVWVLEAHHRAEANFIGQWHEGEIDLLLTMPFPEDRQDRPWYTSLRALRPNMQMLFVEDAEDGFHLTPEYQDEEFPVQWVGLREALAKAFVGTAALHPSPHGAT